MRCKFIHYKLVHRYYFTPLKLFKMGLTQNKKCWKCNKEEGTFLHAIWDCPRVLPFWKMILKKFEEWLKLPLLESPQLCLLGDKSLIPSSLTKAELGLILTGCMVAARIILRNWKSPCKPEFAEWLKIMTETTAFENMIARVNNVPSKISQMWQAFLACIRDGVGC